MELDGVLINIHYYQNKHRDLNFEKVAIEPIKENKKISKSTKGVNFSPERKTESEFSILDHSMSDEE